MELKTEYFFCSPRLLDNIPELEELEASIAAIKWKPEFSIPKNGGAILHHQAAYNEALRQQFVDKYGWENQPVLHSERPKLIGDFMKADIFVEVQFGNSSTLFRDYYKFHYGLTHGLLSLAVLIVPVKAKEFFPTRPRSVQNMAEFGMAARYFKLLPIPVPILLVGLLPSNE